MQSRKYEFLIVGSGAGGATLARELAGRGRDVLVLERGKREGRVGTFKDCTRYYDADRLALVPSRLTKMPRRSNEGVIIWRTFMAGGTTVVSCANGVRSLEQVLSELGISLEEEFAEAEREMRIAPIDERLLSEGSARIREACEEIGYKMGLMPKFIDPVECRRCGQCIMGCASSAKWTALEYLDEAEDSGADIVYDTVVEHVLIENGKARGVSAVGPQGRIEVLADTVILAAGGLATPVILQQSGIEDAGSDLFVDLFVNTYGVAEELALAEEPEMTLVDVEFHEVKGFILSPMVYHSRRARYLETGLKGLRLPNNRLIGMMTKIADEPAGRVHADGTISKPVTEKDRTGLREGSSISREILVKAGVDENSILVSKVQGAHPGGTAGIGRIVNTDLQTEIDNLFVCDASVFPTAPGLPPIVTIVALAKRLAKILSPLTRQASEHHADSDKELMTTRS
jgi:choline dehydrogenase-like flavoprotein